MGEQEEIELRKQLHSMLYGEIKENRNEMLILRSDIKELSDSISSLREEIGGMKIKVALMAALIGAGASNITSLMKVFGV